MAGSSIYDSFGMPGGMKSSSFTSMPGNMEPSSFNVPSTIDWAKSMDGFDIRAFSGMGGGDPKIPTIGAAAGAVDPARGLGMNLPTLQMGFGALNSLGSLYAAFQSNALAKKQFGFQKEAYNQNLTNSIQSYNTSLGDRARSRAVLEGQTDAQRDKYISDNSLKRGG